MPAMSTTVVPAPTSLLRFGHARAEITPPVGIYHRMWGAARHDRATGVHRPLVADVLVLAPLEPAPPEPAPPEGPRTPRRLGGSWCGPTSTWWGCPRPGTRPCAGRSPPAPGRPWRTPSVAYSHSHSAGWLLPDRSAFPGGELIAPYLDDLATRLGDAARRAAGALRPATVTYARGRCAMGANRDYWDAGRGHFVCGTNPDAAGRRHRHRRPRRRPPGGDGGHPGQLRLPPHHPGLGEHPAQPGLPRGDAGDGGARHGGALRLRPRRLRGHRPPLRLYRRPPRRRPERAGAGLRRPRGPGRAAPPRHRPALRRPGALRGHPGGLAGRPLLRLAPGPAPHASRGASTRSICPSSPSPTPTPCGRSSRRGSAGREKRTPGAMPAPPATTGPGRSGPGAGSPAWRTSRRAPPTPCPTPCTASGTPSGWPAGASPTAPCRWSYGAASPPRRSSSPPSPGPSRWPTCSPPSATGWASTRRSPRSWGPAAWRP